MARPERLADLLPPVVADLAATHRTPNGEPMTTDLTVSLKDRRVTHLVPAQTGTGKSPRYVIHLVRGCESGTPGPFLCGMERFDRDAPGWSLRGGVSGRDVVNEPCQGCAEMAAANFPGLGVVSGVGAEEIRTVIDGLSGGDA